MIDRQQLRQELGGAVLRIQNSYRVDHQPEEVLPELIAALLSLAWFVSKNNADLNEVGFLQACLEAVKEPTR